MGRILRLFNDIRSSKRWKRNSDLYQDVVNAMQSYTEQMDKTVTEESARKLYNISRDLKNKADLYLASRKNPKTSRGKARYSMIREIASLNSMPDELRDPIKVESLKKEGKKLSDIVDNVRNNNVVDITNQVNKKVYGAGASKRVRFDYAGRDGFFTEKQKIETNEEIVAREHAKLKSEKKELFEKMQKSGVLQIAEMPASVEGKTDSKLLDVLFLSSGADIRNFNEQEISDVLDYYKEINKQGSMTEIANGSAGIALGSEMSKRNVATSRMAHMLQMDSNIAFSENVIVVDRGVTSEGSFMATAVGYDSRSETGMKFMADKEFDFTSPSFQRDVSRMQVFDMLCGQIDRHGGNFFYQVDSKPVNGKYVITGLQGIDNDMSFGEIDLKGRSSEKMVTIDKLNAIDEDILQSVRELTPEQIQYTMGEMLSKNEIDAVIKRRAQILQRVDEGEVTIVRSDGWGEHTLSLMEESLYYNEIKREVSTAGIALTQKHDEIVDEYDATIKRIEAYNEKHPEASQKIPAKPEHYDEYKADKAIRQLENVRGKYEETMEKFEADVRQADKERKPLPDVPQGYAQYRKERETKEMLERAEVIPERKEVALDGLFDNKIQVTHMDEPVSAPIPRKEASKSVGKK